MIPARDLLVECSRKGIILSPVGDRIAIDGPAEAVTDELLDTLRAQKADLLRELLHGISLNYSASDGRWNPELAAEGYHSCLDCRHWGGGGCDNPTSGPGCTHPDNPFRHQQPLAPRKCRWYQE